MNRYVHQIPFAAQGAFSWNRNTVHNGAPVKAGDPVDTSAFTPVRLRQMYDARIIVPAVGFADSPKPAFIDLGVGKADQIAAELAREEGRADVNSGASVSAKARGANAAQSAAAAAPAAAETLDKSKQPAKRQRAKRAA